jgi:Zn-dependent protease
MLPTRNGAFRLFRFAGIDVYLHWLWFLVAAYEIGHRAGNYSSVTWNLLEYLGLFAIVTMHEFGHSLACRSVGGRANQIVLWPLGGVAYVDPPARPGATLWSIAAGPLVNVVLVPVLTVIGLVSRTSGLAAGAPNFQELLRNLWIINLILLIFNMLPVYPLDGGQILRSLLWFVIGRARSLKVACVIGFVGVAGLVGLAVWWQSFWLGILAAFAGTRCWAGWQSAQALTQLAEAPRHEGFACPSCHAAPPLGALWICSRCRTKFDTFETGAACPHCAAQFEQTRCLDCGALNSIRAWAPATVLSPPLL